MSNVKHDGPVSSAFDMKELPGLDAMRSAAIIMVVLFHQGFPVSGYLGVTMFFVLSGFLITRLLLTEVRKTGAVSFRNFYKRRAMRIFPAFYLCWVVTTIVMFIQHKPIVWKQAAESFFYLANYARAVLPIQQQESFHMGISWSLANEEQFYLLWPIALVWIIKRHHPIPTVLSVVILFVAFWRALLMLLFHVGWAYTYNAFDTRADALLMGCWLAAFLQGKRVSSLPNWARKSRWMVVLPIFSLILCARVDLSKTSQIGVQLTTLTLEPVFSGFLLLQLMIWGSIGWNFLEHWIVKLIARLSYSIYLYHPLVLGLQRFIPIPHAQRATVILLVIAVSAASYYLVERPIMRLRDRGKNESVLLDDGLHHAPGQ